MMIFQTVAVAFSMYSRLPMPKVEWNARNMRYAMCAFPLIGAVIGGAVWLWAAFCARFALHDAMRAMGVVLLPAAITGGIHLDGFCDTADALASHAPMERKLEILKDSHTGAFAIIAICAYFLFCFAAAMQLKTDRTALMLLGLGYLLSRCLSGFAVARFRCAKNSGLVHAFADAAAKKAVALTLAAASLLLCAGMLWISPVAGGGMAAAAAACFGYYRVMSYRRFGGITGDLAGWFLQVCEAAMLFALVICQAAF